MWLCDYLSFLNVMLSILLFYSHPSKLQRNIWTSKQQYTDFVQSDTIIEKVVFVWEHFKV